MKTIKLSLLGILYLFISVLLLRYAVISLNYITTDFITTSSKDILNFGVTFGAQSIILIALALLCIANAISAFTTSYNYYTKWKLDYRNRQLIKYNEEEKYNDLCKLLRDTSSTDKKEELINEFLDTKKSKGYVNAYIQGLNAHKEIDEYIKSLKLSTNKEGVTISGFENMPNRMARTKTRHNAIKDVVTKAKEEIVIERDTFDPLGFEKKE